MEDNFLDREASVRLRSGSKKVNYSDNGLENLKNKIVTMGVIDKRKNLDERNLHRKKRLSVDSNLTLAKYTCSICTLSFDNTKNLQVHESNGCISNQEFDVSIKITGIEINDHFPKLILHKLTPAIIQKYSRPNTISVQDFLKDSICDGKTDVSKNSDSKEEYSAPRISGPEREILVPKHPVLEEKRVLKVHISEGRCMLAYKKVECKPEISISTELSVSETASKQKSMPKTFTLKEETTSKTTTSKEENRISKILSRNEEKISAEEKFAVKEKILAKENISIEENIAAIEKFPDEHSIPVKEKFPAEESIPAKEKFPAEESIPAKEKFPAEESIPTRANCLVEENVHGVKDSQSEENNHGEENIHAEENIRSDENNLKEENCETKIVADECNEEKSMPKISKEKYTSKTPTCKEEMGKPEITASNEKKVPVSKVDENCKLKYLSTNEEKSISKIPVPIEENGKPEIRKGRGIRTTYCYKEDTQNSNNFTKDDNNVSKKRRGAKYLGFYTEEEQYKKCLSKILSSDRPISVPKIRSKPNLHSKRRLNEDDSPPKILPRRSARVVTPPVTNRNISKLHSQVNSKYSKSGSNIPITIYLSDSDDPEILSSEEEKHSKLQPTSSRKRTEETLSNSGNHSSSNSGKVCQVIFLPRKDMQSNIAPQTEVKTSKYTCSFCESTYNRKKMLNMHILQNHSSERPYLCFKCGNGFPIKSLLRRHERNCETNHPEETIVDVEEPPIQLIQNTDNFAAEVTTLCSVCSVTCHNHLDLINHMMTHTDIPVVNETPSITLINETSYTPMENELSCTPIVNRITGALPVNEIFFTPLVNEISCTTLVNEISYTHLVSKPSYIPAASETLHSPEANQPPYFYGVNDYPYYPAVHETPYYEDTNYSSYFSAVNETPYIPSASEMRYTQPISESSYIPPVSERSYIPLVSEIYIPSVSETQKILPVNRPGLGYLSGKNETPYIPLNDQLFPEENGMLNNYPEELYPCEPSDFEDESSNMSPSKAKVPTSAAGFYEDMSTGIEKDDMKAHKRKSFAGIYKCNFCSYKTKYYGSLNKHEMQVHNRMPPSQNNTISLANYIHCQFCSYATRYKCNMQSHQKRMHNGKEGVSCDLCPFQTTKSSDLKTHQLEEHSTRPVSTFSTCKKCNVAFDSYNALKSHRMKHLRNNTSCDSIVEVPQETKPIVQEPVVEEIIFLNDNTESKRNGSLASSGKSLHVCDICAKRFARKHFLDEHLKFAHTVNSSCSTSENEKVSLPSNQVKRKTMKKVKGTSPHQCKLCLVVCINQDALQKHLQRH